MYSKKLPESYDCGITVANKVIGGKWNAWLIDCIRRGAKRPSDIHREMYEANPRVLNMGLRELTAFGILSKTIYAEQPMRVEYFLTPLGESILPLIDAMERWGNEHREQVLSTAF